MVPGGVRGVSSAAVTRATLYILSGLPGSGKSTLAQLLAARVGAAHLRIDTIEQALRELCSVQVVDEGYRLAYRVAGDILGAGVSVVADSCNPVELTRWAWERVAMEARADHVNLEIVCSDVEEHRRRVEQRSSTVPGLRLPTWPEVRAREFDAWTRDRIVIDTAGRSAAECADALTAALAARSRSTALGS